MYQTKEGMWVHDAGEEGVRKQQGEYRALLEVFRGRPCGPVWDVGAHVGWFAWYVTRHLRPSAILCVECAPRQIEALRRNLPGGCQLLEGALVPESYLGETTTLYLGKTYSSCDTTYSPVRGRTAVEVPVVRPRDLRHALPDPEVVKLDCEGAEYCLDPARHVPKTVRVVVAEYHYNRPGQRESLLRLNRGFEDIGFRLLKPLRFSDYKKTMHVSYVRDLG